MSNYSGKQLGNYRLLRSIGRGTFGETYLAEQMSSPNRQVAIKLLNASFSSPKGRDRFLAEAQIFERLWHPHLVPTIDIGIDEGIPYIVSEYMPNGSLRDHLDRQWALSEISTLVTQIAEALAYLHGQHTLHRNLKPENILLKKEKETYQCYLADLSQIIIVIDEVHRFSAPGTMAYLAPEQFGGGASAASDQYALAIIVFEWLTGQTPFVGSPQDTWLNWAQKHQKEVPAELIQLNPSVSQEIEQVILKALAKYPEERYVDVATFAAALQIAVKKNQEKDGSFPVAWYKQRLEEYEQILRAESFSEQGTSLDGETPLAMITECLTKPYIEKALARLSWVERSCLLLRIDAQFAPDEIAEIMDIGEQQVNEALEQGRERMLQNYYRYLEQEQILLQDQLHTPTESDDSRIGVLLMSVLASDSEGSANFLNDLVSEESQVLRLAQLTSGSEQAVVEDKLSSMDRYLPPAFAYDDDSSWSTLYSWLESRVRNWVYASHSLRWRSEEEGIIEDIVSESVIRILDRLRKVNRGEADPIKSLYRFARQVAHNYFIDLLRKDRKSVRFSQLIADGEDAPGGLFPVDLDEVILKAVGDERFFKLMAQEIVTLPKKQKEAVLRDHAKLIDGMVDPASLIRAYQSLGIQLKDYCNYVPASLIEKRRHSSLLHLAYRRLSRILPTTSDDISYVQSFYVQNSG